MATSVIKAAIGRKLDASEFTVTLLEGVAHGTITVIQGGATVYVYMVVTVDTSIANGETAVIGDLLVGGKVPVGGVFGVGYATVSNIRKPILGWVTSGGELRITNLTGAQIPANTQCVSCVIAIY